MLCPSSMAKVEVGAPGFLIDFDPPGGQWILLINIPELGFEVEEGRP